MESIPTRPAPRSDVPGLAAFAAIARAGTVGGAAAELGLTQPAVSARLAALEAAWGTRLFVRRARGMELNAEGTRLLPRALRLLAELAELDAAAGAPLAGPAELRVGAGDALGRERLPRALSALLREEPGLEIRLREGPRAALLAALRSGEIDVALVVDAPDDGAGLDLAGLDLAPWIESPVDVLAPPGTRLPRRPGVAWLARRRTVALPPGSGFRAHVERALPRTARPGEAPAVEVGNLSLVRRFVAAGLGVAAVPAVAFDAADRQPRVERRRLAGIPPVRYARALRAGAPRGPALQRFLDALRSSGR